MKIHKISKRSKLEIDGEDRDLDEQSSPEPEDGEDRSHEMKMTGSKRRNRRRRPGPGEAKQSGDRRWRGSEPGNEDDRVQEVHSRPRPRGGVNS